MHFLIIGSFLMIGCVCLIHDNHQTQQILSNSLVYNYNHEPSQPPSESVGLNYNHEPSQPPSDSVGLNFNHEPSQSPSESVGLNYNHEPSQPPSESVGLNFNHEPSQPPSESIGRNNNHEPNQSPSEPVGHNNNHEPNQSPSEPVGHNNNHEPNQSPSESVGHNNNHEPNQPPSESIGRNNNHEPNQSPSEPVGLNNNHEPNQPPSESIGRNNNHEPNQSPSEPVGLNNNHEPSQPPSEPVGHNNNHEPNQSPSESVGLNYNHEPNQSPSEPVGHNNNHEPNQPPSESIGRNNNHEPNQLPSEPVGHNNNHEPNQSPSEPVGHNNNHEPNQSPSESVGLNYNHEPNQSPSESVGLNNNHEPNQPPSESVGLNYNHEPNQSPSEPVGLNNNHEPNQSPSESVVLNNNHKLNQSSSESVGHNNNHEPNQSSSESVVLNNNHKLNQSPSESVGLNYNHEPNQSSSESVGHNNNHEPNQSSSESVVLNNNHEPNQPPSESVGLNYNHEPNQPPSESVGLNYNHEPNQSSSESVGHNNNHEPNQPPSESVVLNNNHEPNQPPSESVGLNYNHEPNQSSSESVGHNNNHEPNQSSSESVVLNYNHEPNQSPSEPVGLNNNHEPSQPPSEPVGHNNNHEPNQSPSEPVGHNNNHEPNHSSSNHESHQLSSTSLAFRLQNKPAEPYRTALRENLGWSRASTCPETCRCSYRPDRTVKVVDCSHKGFTKIPKLPALAVEVYLQSNKINEIGRDNFSHLRVLRTLDLSGNKLAKVGNETFQSLSSLVFLSLRLNLLPYEPGTFETGAFSGLTSLESLHLEGNLPNSGDHLVYPDQALAQVPTLRSLWLDGYPLPLGPGFSSLVNLSYISFATDHSTGGHCSLKDVPADFFFHIATKQNLSINMSNCFIHDIPPEVFEHVPTIHTLDLVWNEGLTMDGFEKASEGLKSSNLTVLNISYIVPPFYPFDALIKNTTFRNLRNTKLRILVAENNKLVFIDAKAILDLPETVEYISFDQNQIQIIFWVVPLLRLHHLKTARVSERDYQVHLHSKFFTPNSFQSNKKYKSTLWNNGSTEKLNPYEMSNLTQEMTRYFEDTNEKRINDSAISKKNPKHRLKPNRISIPIPLPPALENIFARHAIPTYVKFPHNLSFKIVNNKVLKHLDLSNNDIVSIDAVFSGVPSLQVIDFSNNRCEYVNPNIMSSAPNLTSIVANNNRLGTVLASDTDGVIFSHVTLLETLDLSHNDIKDLSEKAFDKNKHLRYLNLSNNALSHFRPNLINNINLEVLDLSYNQLRGFSQTACQQLLAIKGSNSKFAVRIKENSFKCSCDNLPFLSFVLDHPELFDDVNTFRCQLDDGVSVSRTALSHLLPELRLQCVIQPIFVTVLIAFFLTTGSLALFSLYHYKRWQWKYLYYMSKTRLHIGSMHLTFRPAAHAFVTYDQENRRLRDAMRTIFLPRLHEMGVTTVLGEFDFAGGPLAQSIAGAVTTTGKTLVFFSPGMFEEYYRRLEINFAIMHELHVCRPVLVPVILFGDDVLPAPAHQVRDIGQPDSLESMEEADDGPERVSEQQTRRWSQRAEPHPRDSFERLLRDFPPEISMFLHGQMHRCLVYPGDRDDFWRLLRNVIMGE